MKAQDLINLAELLAAHLNRSPATISNKAVGNATLFERLASGKGCTLRVADTAMAWFDRHWPDDLEWPSDIPRPKTKEEAA